MPGLAGLAGVTARKWSFTQRGRRASRRGPNSGLVQGGRTGSLRGRTATVGDRAAIVTGAAHGIGRVVASHLAHSGWQVILADIDGAAASEAAAAMGGAGVACDVSDEADVERLVAVARARDRKSVV